MSSVLHPVGPEPRERYWVRRVAVLVAAVVVIGVVIALVGNAMSAGSAVQAEPAAPSPVFPTVVATPSATPSAAPTPGSTGSPTPGTTPGGTPAATPSASAAPTPGDTVTPDPGQTPKAERSTPPTSTDSKKAAAEKAAQKKAAEQKKAAAQKKKAPVLAACPTSGVRTTLTGPRTVKAGKPVDFDLSVINSSSTTCYLKVASDNVTLTVVSGKDRIWTTDDCAKTIPSQSRKLSPQKSVDWSSTWNGKRSADGCTSRPEKVKPGYYWAIASFDDAPEVRWRLILT
jgi:hypothetical protein